MPSSLGGAHLVESGDGIEKPDVMAAIVVVAIAEMRIQSVVVVLDIFFGIARTDPGFLHGDAVVGGAWRQLAFLVALDPVVAVVADGANQLLSWGSP